MNSIDMLLGCGKKLTEIPTAEVEVSRLTEMAGEPFIIRIRALTAREFDELPKDDFKAHVILKAAIDPDLADTRIADMLKPAERSARLTPAEVVNTLFLPGEVINLYNAITDLSGFGEESIKNIRKKLRNTPEFEFMLYLFHTHNILPGQYYDMPTGEKIMLRAFVDEILERSK